MKRRFLTTLTMSAILVFGTATATFAQTSSPSPGKTSSTGIVTLEAEVQPTYVVEIPDDINFGIVTLNPNSQENAQDLPIKLLQNVGFAKVNVSLLAPNWELSDGTKKIQYSLRDKDTNAPLTDAVASLVNKGDSKDCQVVLDRSTITQTGKYTGMINFKFDGTL